MRAKQWRRLIEKLPPGLGQCEAAKILRKPPGTVRFWLLKLGYKFKDGRCQKWSQERHAKQRTVDYGAIDWTQRNIDISRATGLSRQRIHQIRAELGIAKVGGREHKQHSVEYRPCDLEAIRLARDVERMIAADKAVYDKCHAQDPAPVVPVKKRNPNETRGSKPGVKRGHYKKHNTP